MDKETDRGRYITIIELLPHIMLKPFSLTNFNAGNQMLWLFLYDHKVLNSGLFRNNLCDFQLLPENAPSRHNVLQDIAY